MHTISISRKELKKIMQETFADVLTERKDIIEGAVLEALEDLGLARAMESGRTGDYINTVEFKKKLNAKLQRSK